MKIDSNDSGRFFDDNDGSKHLQFGVFGTIMLLLLGCTSVVAANGPTEAAEQNDGDSDRVAQADGDSTSDQSADSSEDRGDASSGEPIYDEDCAMCHGDQGAGDGPAGAAFDMPDFTDTDYMAEVSDDYLYQVIDEGNDDMPAFGDAYSDDEIDDLVAYIRTFAQ